MAGLAAPRRAAAQGCCGAGGGTGQHEAFHHRLGPWEAVVGLSLETARSGSAYRGVETIDDPLNRSAQATSFSASLGVGLPRGFTVHVLVPVNEYDRSYDIRIGSGTRTLTYTGSGLGDPSVALTWRTPSARFNHPWSFQIGAGLQMPLGEDELRQNGVRLPVDVQPAAGSWNTLAIGSVTWERGSWSAYQDALWTLRGANTIGYKFGNTVQTSLGLGYSLTAVLEPQVQVALAYSDHDVWRGRTLSNTGGTQWLLAIGALAHFRPQYLSFAVTYRLPVYQSYSGNQLGNDHAVIASILYWP